MRDRPLRQRPVAGLSPAMTAVRLVVADRRASVAILIAFSTLLWLPSLAAPLDIDAAGYALVAYWWARGDTLYQTLTITRPQGIFVVYRLIEALGLGSVRGLHLAAALCAMLCTLALDALVRRVWGTRVGFASALLFAALLALPATGGYSANAELFMLLPLLGSLYLLVRADEGALDQPGAIWRLVGCGFLAAIALLIKPAAYTSLPLASLWLARRWRVEGCDRSSWWRAEVALGTGAVLGLLPAVAHGLVTAPQYYLDAVVFYRFTQDSIVSASLQSQLARARDSTLVMLWQLPILVIAPAGLWPAASDRRDLRGARAWLLLWLWMVAALGGVALGGNWFPHYYLQLLPPLAVAVVLGACKLLRRAARPSLIVLQGVALAAGLSFLLSLGLLLAPLRHPLCLLTDDVTARSPSGRIAAYLRAHTTPDATIYVSYHQPDIYYLAQRRPAARWLYYRELALVPGAFAEQVARLSDPRTAPCYVVGPRDNDPFSFDLDGSLHAVLAVAAHYQLAATVDGVPLYRAQHRVDCIAPVGMAGGRAWSEE